MENEVQSIEISKDVNIGEVVIKLINESIQMINQSLNITFMYEGDISVLLDSNMIMKKEKYLKLFSISQKKNTNCLMMS